LLRARPTVAVDSMAEEDGIRRAVAVQRT